MTSVQDLQDPRRVEPTFLLGEREMLEGWLEFHRLTLLLKCEGLDDAARKSRPVPTSLLSLHGLVRHMAEVERGWFRRALLSQPDLPFIYCSANTYDDRELAPLDDANWADDLTIWHQECDASRQAAANLDLDATGTRRDQAVSLRWIVDLHPHDRGVRPP
jgi:uncharacterized damage-inducible protein DinB